MQEGWELFGLGAMPLGEEPGLGQVQTLHINWYKSEQKLVYTHNRPVQGT